MRGLGVVLITSALTCSNAGASLNAEEDRRSLAASYLVLFAPNSQGVPVPVCGAKTAGRPDLLPATLEPAATTTEVDLNLPTCTPSQELMVHGLISDMVRPKYAALPVALAPICAINFMAAASLVVIANMSQNRMLSDQVTGFALGAGTAPGIWQGIDFAGKLGLGAVGFICSAAGVYAGYALVPAPYSRR